MLGGVEGVDACLGYPLLSSYGTFAILRERAQESVRTIVESEARAKAAPGTNSQKAGDLYQRYMDDNLKAGDKLYRAPADRVKIW